MSANITNEQGDSDDELHMQPVDFNASRDVLIEALKSSQLSVSKLLNENRTLRKLNSDLLASTSKKYRNTGEQNLLGYKPEIVGLAKRFLYTRALFITVSAFREQLSEMPANIGSQFSTDEAYTQSIAKALYEDIPPKFHPLLDYRVHSAFAKDFIREFGDGRSAIIITIRKNLPTILSGIANIDADILTTASADRSNNDAIAKLLRFPNEQKPSRYPPILFPGRQNMTEVFTGPVVMKIHRLMYFGPKSLVAGNKPALNSNGVKLGLDAITESSLSTAAILARFVLSPDKEWASRGAISGIEWEEDYRAYHKMLACNRELPHVKKILRKVHTFVFAGAPATLTAADDNADTDEETDENMAELMRQFELGTDPEDDHAAMFAQPRDVDIDAPAPLPVEEDIPVAVDTPALPIDPVVPVEVTDGHATRRSRARTATATIGSGSGSSAGVTTRRGRNLK
ncbi:hypothetical protein C8R43DRAFT_1028342 [Mycena crocata]|nr:hypothetical protein C8R43DRAFT_1028342 [Mycena crocata]